MERIKNLIPYFLLLLTIVNTIILFYHINFNGHERSNTSLSDNVAPNKITIYTKDKYAEKLESEYNAARENLAKEVEKYITTIAPKSVVNALTLVDLSSRYNVDIRFVLSQGHLESHFATAGTASKTNSIFNVGAYDGDSAEQQKRNGFGYEHPDYSIEPYLKLLTNDYLVDGKTENDLLVNFVNKSDMRYASDENYEVSLKSIYNNIDNIANISETYETFKMYKLKLGR